MEGAGLRRPQGVERSPAVDELLHDRRLDPGVRRVDRRHQQKRGERCGSRDRDQQDPPEMIAEFQSFATTNSTKDSAVSPAHDRRSALGPVDHGSSTFFARAWMASLRIASQVKLATPLPPLISVVATAKGTLNLPARVFAGL